MRNRFHPQKPAWRSVAGRFFYARPSLLDPAPDGLLVPLASTARRLLPTPTKPMQQATDVIAVVANAKAPPKKVCDALRGPDGGGKSVRFSTVRQQPWKLSQLCASQFGRATRARDTTQPGHSSSAGLLRPLVHSLPTHTQLAGNGGQRFAPADAGQGGQAARLQNRSVSSHEWSIRCLSGM
jgi:hypothetical protein